MNQMELKSSYELASRRTILSSYAIEQEKEDKKKKEIDAAILEDFPEYVLEWEKQQDPESNYSEKKEEKKFVDVVKEPTKLFTSEELEKSKKEKTIMKVSIEKNEDLKNEVVEPETISYDNLPEVHWYGHFTSYSGFSRMNRAMAFGLSNRGVKVKLDVQSGSIDINESTKREIDLLSNTDISKTAPKVFGATLPLTMAHYGKKILYTMMETSGTLHKDYVDRLNLFDEIWVPTRYGENLFKQNGVLRPIKVMPLGVDIERYDNFKTNPYDFGDSLNEFVFLSVFKWGHRKGYDILLKAYMDEFSAEDNTSLVLLTRCETDPNPTRIQEDMGFIRSGINKKDEDLPHISVCTKHYAEKDMPKIYMSANAFVLISLGEGFCLPIVEAASCGLPVIASNCTAQTDYLTNENSFLVEPSSYSIAKVNGNMSRLAKHCRFYEDQSFPVFGEEEIMQTRKHMRYVYENNSAAKKKAKILQKEIRENYSWEKSVDKVYKRILELN